MKAYEGKYFAFIGAIRWLLKPYANYEGKFNFKQKIMGIKAGLWSDLFKWLMFCRGQGLLTRDLSSFFYSSHSLRVILLITCIPLFHCEYSPLIANFSLGDWLCSKGVPVPVVLIPDLFSSSLAWPGISCNYKHRDTETQRLSLEENSVTLFLCVYSEK